VKLHSPWYFSHFTYANAIAKSELLFPMRWQQMIQLMPDLIDLISWNNFGESDYLGPIEGAMPNGSNKWVNGFDHTLWLRMSQYYITAYKTGSFPPISTDQIYFWFRTSSKNANCDDPLGKPANWEWADDIIVVFSLLTAPAQVTIVSSGKIQQFDASAGANLFAMPFQQGTVSILLKRDGPPHSKTSNKQIDNIISSYNFNAYVDLLEYDPNIID